MIGQTSFCMDLLIYKFDNPCSKGYHKIPTTISGNVRNFGRRLQTDSASHA